MAMLDDLKAILDPLGAVHLGGFLDAPDDAIALLESPGLAPVRGMGGPGAAAVAVEYAGVQVLVRRPDYASARDLAVAALNLLDNAGPFVTAAGARYDAITAQQRPPFFVGPDRNDRRVFSFNLLVAKGATA